MPDPEKIPEPTELVYLPRPSWAPALLAFGALMIVNGIYGEGILFRGNVYMLFGAVIALGAVRSMIMGAVRDFYERPRKQRQGAAVLPAGSLRPPPKSG
jgi:hypothetical protein